VLESVGSSQQRHLALTTDRISFFFGTRRTAASHNATRFIIELYPSSVHHLRKQPTLSSSLGKLGQRGEPWLRHWLGHRLGHHGTELWLQIEEWLWMDSKELQLLCSLSSPPVPTYYQLQIPSENREIPTINKQKERIHAADMSERRQPRQSSNTSISKRPRKPSLRNIDDDKQRERKRALDRKAQRASREKTRSHIAHLEKMVQILSDKNGNTATSELMEEMGRLHAEIDRLRKIIDSIKSVLGADILESAAPR
jgi:hypothetical protein